MEKFNGIFWCSIGGGIINFIGHGNAAHWNRSIGQRLGHGDDIGAHIEFLGGKWGSHTAKAGDDLIKYQQQSMLVTNLADFFQIANWRNQCSG